MPILLKHTPAFSELAAGEIDFERYDFVDQDGIRRRGGPCTAWFGDPAGNVLSVLEERP